MCTHITHILYRINISTYTPQIIQILSDVVGLFLFNPEGRSVGEKKTVGFQ